MNQAKVSELYDRLLATELRFRREKSYPIHKSLSFPQPHISDVYHWIEEQVGLPTNGLILDAGCGIGWGTRYLANRTKSKLLGISVSPAEIQQARQYQQPAPANVAFKLGSFDQIEANRYDMIIAVESLKHSADINATIKRLIDGLVCGGTLVVVDDIYCGIEKPKLIGQFKKDWQLTDILCDKHFIDANKLTRLNQVDLTPYMTSKTRLVSMFKQWMVSALLQVRPKSLGLQAFRGGFCLDRFYANQSMQYRAVICHKER